ncbi:MAG TPA: FAD-dependent oxidoreductase [Chitinophagaceae bacterium]|jgi:monoamine oxidase|nr:FAD-dependent oxidoreductase [Chitinophagaceae bacterium]
MSYIKSGSRVPLLNVLRKAFFLTEQSRQKGSAPLEELAARSAAEGLHRRRFIGDTFKAGIALSAAGLLNGCRQAADLLPEPSPASTTALKANGPKIAILGAGIAGLNCAYQLKKSGYAAAVYEGSQRTGGRMYSAKNVLHPTLVTELGGEFIDTEHKEMLKLCHEFGLPLLDTLSKEEAAFTRDSFFIDGQFYTEEQVIAAFEPFHKRIAADIRSLDGFMTFDRHNEQTLYFDQLSISAYLDSIGMQGFLRTGIEVAYLTEYGRETNDQSSINFLFLFVAKTAQGFSIFGTSDERYKVAGGNQRVTDALFNQVKNQVQLEHKLVRIAESGSGYLLSFSKAGGSTVSVKADLVVCTIPFSVLKEVELAVALPAWKRNAIEQLGYGTNSKLFLGFNQRVWRNSGHSAYMFSDSEIQTGWDNSALQPTSAAGFTVYQGGIKGIQLGEGTPAQQAPKFVAQLEQMWPGCAKAYTGVAKRMHWPEHPFTRGSYACYRVGQYTTIRGAEIKPVGNLFFAGEHCSSYYQGFMNGAAETGRMAATEVLKAAKAKDSVAVK